jgi:hypothetical protein
VTIGTLYAAIVKISLRRLFIVSYAVWEHTVEPYSHGTSIGIMLAQ